MSELRSPQNLTEARDAMRAGDAVGAPLRLVGADTKASWGNATTDSAAIVSSAKLRGVHAYDPADMTATVGAGTPLAELQRALAENDQWLAIDPPLGDGERATVGGIFAADDSGPRRLRHGTLRGLVIGMTYVLADGTVARSGSNVIKNVAGYDMCKLLCGSLGTLGFVATLTVRLHPRPATTRTVGFTCGDNHHDTWGLVQAVMRSPLEAQALEHDGRTLWARFAGSTTAVEAQARRITEMGAALGLAPARTPDDEVAHWQRLTEMYAGEAGETVLRLGTLPTAYPRVAATVHTLADTHGLTLQWQSHAALGVHTARLRGGDAAGHDALITAMRQQIVRPAHVTIRRRAPGVAAPTFDRAPVALTSMRRLKDALDPKRRCNPGRFVGGL